MCVCARHITHAIEHTILMSTYCQVSYQSTEITRSLCTVISPQYPSMLCQLFSYGIYIFTSMINIYLQLIMYKNIFAVNKLC